MNDLEPSDGSLLSTTIVQRNLPKQQYSHRNRVDSLTVGIYVPLLLTVRLQVYSR